MNAPRQTQSFESLAARHGPRYRWMVLAVVGLSVVSSLLASTSFNVAVPSLMARFGIGQTDVQWTITGFMAAMTVSMLPTAWLLTTIGFRRLLLGAIAVMAAAGIAGSFAPSFAAVVALRIVQGAAAGVLQPLGTIAVMRLFPREQQGRASGILGFSVVLAPALAPTFAGMVLDRHGWPAIFLLNVPFCVLTLVAGWFLLPAARPAERTRFDWPGLGMLALATLAIIEAVANLQRHGLASPWTLGLFALAIAGWAGFARHARRAKHPIVGLHAFADRSFAMGTIVTFAYGFGLYASSYLIPVFLQHAAGYTATAAGAALLPSGLALAVAIPLAGRLADTHSPRLVTIIGLAMFGLSFVYFGIFASRMGNPEVIGATVFGRVGLGLLLPAVSIATLHFLRTETIPAASVVVGYLRQLGGVLGVAIVAVFVTWREDSRQAAPHDLASAYAEGFLLIAAMFVVAIVAASRMRSRATLN